MIAKKDLATFSGDDAHNMNEDKIFLTQRLNAYLDFQAANSTIEKLWLTDDNDSSSDSDPTVGIRGDSSSNEQPFATTVGISTVLSLRAGEYTPTKIVVAASMEPPWIPEKQHPANSSNVSKTIAARQLTTVAYGKSSTATRQILRRT
nr:eukaryotic translation initiation factor 3 subunit M-like isoform X2 [Ipomoea batatas]